MSIRFLNRPYLAISALRRCSLQLVSISALALLLPALPATSAIADSLGSPASCVIESPAGEVPIGRPVWLGAAVSNRPAGELTHRWQFGGGHDRIVRGTTHDGDALAVLVTFERGDQAFPVTLTLSQRGQRIATCRTSIVVGSPPISQATSQPAALVPEQDPPGDPASQSHVVLGFNDLGMHCMDLGSLPLALRPPLSVLQAQVLSRGAPPVLLDDSGIGLQYSAASSVTDPVMTPLVRELADLPPLEGDQTFTARDTLSATNVSVAVGADVHFTAGLLVRLDDGFGVADAATLTVSLDPDLQNEAPSINSTSRNDPPGSSADVAALRKSDFWDPIDPGDPAGPTVAATLFDDDDPAPDEGLTTVNNVDGARRMPGFSDPYVANAPQPFSSYDDASERFLAEGLPLTPIDDSGRLNPYPLLRLQAVDTVGGEVQAAIDVVAPVSSDIRCRDCHRRGEVGADASARSPELPFVDAAVSDDAVEEERAAKQNILLLHDYKWGTSHAGGPTVLCASCHESHTLEARVSVLDPGELPHKSLSNVMHDQHGRFVVDEASKTLVRDVDGEPVLRTVPEPGEAFLLPSDPTDGSIGMEQNCFYCHPGHSAPYFRGVMADPAGLKCSSCHGTILAVGGLFDGDFDGTGVLRQRRPWLDEPRCESCHLGDAVSPGISELPATLAFDAADEAAVPTMAGNRRFAENLGPSGELVLYRDSAGHGGAACSGCHGSPHAVWPHADPNANDNVTALELQGHRGPIADCVVCHEAGSLSSETLGGPHGLHPVGDPDWIEPAGSWGHWSGSGDDCAPCHGADHLGTRLSRALADRELRDARGTLWATVEAGDIISCGLCHSVEDSF